MSIMGMNWQDQQAGLAGMGLSAGMEQKRLRVSDEMDKSSNTGLKQMVGIGGQVAGGLIGSLAGPGGAMIGAQLGGELGNIGGSFL